MNELASNENSGLNGVTKEHFPFGCVVSPESQSCEFLSSLWPFWEKQAIGDLPFWKEILGGNEKCFSCPLVGDSVFFSAKSDLKSCLFFLYFFFSYLASEGDDPTRGISGPFLE